MVSEKNLQFDFGARSDVGVVRDSNQDSALASSNVLLVADGMGGHAGGDVASTIATTMLSELTQVAAPRGRAQTRLSVSDAEQLVKDSITQAYIAILDIVKNEPELAGMGTTLTGIVRAENTFLSFHLGDSRLYRLHEGTLTQMTKDHTFVQRLVDSGKISAEEARNHPQKNVVVRVLGDFEVDFEPDLDYIPICANDRFFICSDGVCGTVDDDTIRQILLEKCSPEDAANELVDLALRNGSTDNCTAVVADVKEITGEPQLPVFAGATQEALQDHLNDLVKRGSDTAKKKHPTKQPEKLGFFDKMLETVKSVFNQVLQ
ncbi:MAG: protein phosphatase 2C domain-containing protein [Candidatus Ancillula sp.]|jgi:protein phosphatase|nr:protein phosphatase 2C domain-containing protein [Candidatus Ancillula sp.]